MWSVHLKLGVKHNSSSRGARRPELCEKAAGMRVRRPQAPGFSD
jgi:hypothetical protein